MRKNAKTKRIADETLIKIDNIVKHVNRVQENCIILGKYLISSGKIDLGVTLIANGYCHDVSKFKGIEFQFMSPTQPTKEDEAKLKLKLAIQHHQKVNPHHVEHWQSIHDMPDVYLCEFCCDILARSQEFGTNLREWIDDEATKRFNFSKEDEVYKKIMEYVDILCQSPFEQIK